MPSNAAPMLRLTAVATLLLAACTSGGAARPRSGGGAPPPSLRTSISPANTIASWSPDGRILWNCARAPSGALTACVTGPDGAGPREIPVDVFFEYPAWSPDGTKIAFMSMEPGAHGTDPEYNVYVMNADGSGLKRLTDSAGQDGFPSWSPDGSKIAFSSTRDDCSNSTAADCRTSGDLGPFHTLYVMNADGSNQRRVVDRFAQFVDWSPDGRYLVFSPGLYIIRPDGSGLTSLQVEVGQVVFPDWTA